MSNFARCFRVDVESVRSLVELQAVEDNATPVAKFSDRI